MSTFVIQKHTNASKPNYVKNTSALISEVFH